MRVVLGACYRSEQQSCATAGCTAAMPRKKVDARVRTLIDNGVKANHRNIIVIVGDQGRSQVCGDRPPFLALRSLLVALSGGGTVVLIDGQVMNLHLMLSKSRVKARPSVLWCYKKDLGFSTCVCGSCPALGMVMWAHGVCFASAKKKRMRQIKKLKARGLYDPDRDDPFELFVASTQIRWAYYKDSAKILGSTYGMCVLQDFEALTPNLLCRTIETVEGGGLIVILLHTMKSLKQLFTMTMVRQLVALVAMRVAALPITCGAWVVSGCAQAFPH